ncbi:MAG: DUF4837 family protein [Bacteroidetes bacterium]|nr:DUF4837 family protein [Bacteroidota bacterium]
MKQFFTTTLLIILFVACKENGSKIQPVSTGKFGEAFVIIDQDLLTDGLRSTLHQAFERPQMLYGGEEPYFKLIYLTPSQAKGSLIYEGTNLIITHSGMKSDVRRLLPPKIDSMVTLRKREGIHTVLKEDVWSSPQEVLFVLGDNVDSIRAFIQEHSDEFLAKMLKMERKEAVGRMTALPNQKIRKEILDKHQIDIKAPISYHIAANSKFGNGQGFIWLRNADVEYDLNLVVHYEPYTDTSQFQLDSLIARRDSVEKRFISGDVKGSYMATDTQFPYFTTTTDFNGHFAREYNALWTMKKDFMGGPYYSITVLDEAHKRLITMEGFVFAPSKEKTSYLRELQGIIYGITF